MQLAESGKGEMRGVQLWWRWCGRVIEGVSKLFGRKSSICCPPPTSMLYTCRHKIGVTDGDMTQ